MGVVVELTPRELAYCRDLALARHAPKVAAGVRSHRIDPNKQDLQIHILGVQGEAVVAKHMGLKVDRMLSLHGDNHAGDVAMRDGRLISVKYRNRRGWAFALTSDNPAEFRCPFGVLVWPAAHRPADGLAFEIVGYTTRSNFYAHMHHANFGYGRRLVLEARWFSPIAELMERAPVEVTPPRRSFERW